MRAVFFPFDQSLAPGKNLIIDGEAARHLEVVRLRLAEKVLLLNGQGFAALTEAASFKKNQVELTVLEIEERSVQHDIKLAIATPKKDAFLDILKIAVELGIREIFPLTSEYSQYDFSPNERTDRILESALIQSNNAFLPVIHTQVKLEAFLENNKAPLYFFDSNPEEATAPLSLSSPSCVVLIGPEGGFSSPERTKIKTFSNVFSIHLPTPILRAPTAVASSIGYLLARQQKDLK